MQPPASRPTQSNRQNESANAEQEIFRNFSKKLVQILKKNENYLLDEINESSKNTRELVTQKHILEKKRNFRVVAFPDDVDLEDAVLKKIAAKASAQLNEIIKSSLGPLSKDSEFVQELPN
jgi:hypothetical protein